MRNTLFAALAVAGLLVAAPAQAQTLNLKIETKEPTTGLEPAVWAQMMTKFINAAPIIGKEAAYLVNATPDTISAVKCDSYYLVGTAAKYGTGTTASPVNLPPWSVTLVPAPGFDGYCKKGVNGIGSMSNYTGLLNGASGTFSDTTFIVFETKAR